LFEFSQANQTAGTAVGASMVNDLAVAHTAQGLTDLGEFSGLGFYFFLEVFDSD